MTNRRALISQRIAHTWTQTDPIPKKDVQVETDGSVTIKKESPGGCNMPLFLAPKNLYRQFFSIFSHFDSDYWCDH